MNSTAHRFTLTLGMIITSLFIFGVTSLINTPLQAAVSAWDHARKGDKPLFKRKKRHQDDDEDSDQPVTDVKNTTGNAQSLLEQAKAARDPLQRSQLKLLAAKALIDGKLLSQAKIVISEINKDELRGPLLLSYQLLAARIALAEQKPKEALALAPKLPESTELDFRIESHQVRAAAYRDLGNRLDSILELFQIEPLIKDPAELSAVHRSIWVTLSQLTPESLKQFRQQARTNSLVGWIDLATLYKESSFAPEQFQSRLAQWKGKFPQHPAFTSILGSLEQEQKAIQSRPERLALLLPLKGSLAKTGTAVRDGFMAAHFAEANDRKRIVIKVYDTSSNSIPALYKKAVDEGAQIVIGPLEKENVRQLLSIPDRRIPVLALNFLDDANLGARADNIIFFGLSPEDEARQVAERAISENKTRAVALIPDNAWGARILRAFTERFKELGGQVLEHGSYATSVSDHKKTLHSLLNLDESHARFRALAVHLKMMVKFDPRRRDDVDFLFIAAFPQQARLIAPQIKFHHGSGLPIYTTSHAYSGVEDLQLDGDMEGIMFCDMPWTLTLSENPAPVQAAVKKNYAAYLRSFSRLYALGVDGYNLIPYLQMLKSQSHQRYQGQTGVLSVDQQNRIRRTLKWAQFKQGKAAQLQQQVLHEKIVSPTVETATESPDG